MTPLVWSALILGCGGTTAVPESLIPSEPPRSPAAACLAGEGGCVEVAAALSEEEGQRLLEAACDTGDIQACKATLTDADPARDAARYLQACRAGVVEACTNRDDGDLLTCDAGVEASCERLRESGILDTVVRRVRPIPVDRLTAGTLSRVTVEGSTAWLSTGSRDGVGGLTAFDLASWEVLGSESPGAPYARVEQSWRSDGHVRAVVRLPPHPSGRTGLGVWTPGEEPGGHALPARFVDGTDGWVCDWRLGGDDGVWLARASEGRCLQGATELFRWRPSGIYDRVPLPSPAFALAASPDGSSIALGLGDGSVMAVDRKTAATTQLLKVAAERPAVAWMGEKLLVGSPAGSVMWTPGPQPPTPLPNLKLPPTPPMSLAIAWAWSESTQRLAIQTRSGVMLLDEAGTPLRPPLRLSERPARSLAFTSDGQGLLIENGTLTLVELGELSPRVADITDLQSARFMVAWERELPTLAPTPELQASSGRLQLLWPGGPPHVLPVPARERGRLDPRFSLEALPLEPGPARAVFAPGEPGHHWADVEPGRWLVATHNSWSDDWGVEEVTVAAGEQVRLDPLPFATVETTLRLLRDGRSVVLEGVLTPIVSTVAGVPGTLAVGHTEARTDADGGVTLQLAPGEHVLRVGRFETAHIVVPEGEGPHDLGDTPVLAPRPHALSESASGWTVVNPHTLAGQDLARDDVITHLDGRPLGNTSTLWVSALLEGARSATVRRSDGTLEELSLDASAATTSP